MNMADTAKEGDIGRYVVNCKRNLELFLSYKGNSKYAVEMVDTIFKIQHQLDGEKAAAALAGKNFLTDACI